MLNGNSNLLFDEFSQNNFDESAFGTAAFDSFNNPQLGSQMSIKKFLIQETGTYNNQYLRPYKSELGVIGLENITSAVERMPNAKLNKDGFSSYDLNFIRPSADASSVSPIANGWDQKRIRFFLEVEVSGAAGSQLVYYFQGYSDYNGISLQSNAIDPNMTFYINSFVKVNRSRINTPTGVGVSERVIEAKQIISPNNWVDDSRYIEPGYMNGMMHQKPGRDVKISPESIYNAMITKDALEDARKYGHGGVYDTRIAINSPELAMSELSRPGKLIGKVITGYLDNSQLSLSQHETEKLSTVIMQSRSGRVTENPFIRTLSMLAGHTNNITSFTMNTLASIDPNVNHVTNYIVSNSSRLSALHQHGTTANWNASDISTQSASIIANAVPSIMMELSINHICFVATNHDIGGLVSINIVAGNCLTNFDNPRIYEIFKSRLKMEVIDMITFNNELPFMLEVKADVSGEIWIKLALGNEPVADFVCPSFCNSLFLPTITNNLNNFYGLVEDFKQVISSVEDVTYGSSRTMNFNDTSIQFNPGGL